MKRFSKKLQFFGQLRNISFLRIRKENQNGIMTDLLDIPEKILGYCFVEMTAQSGNLKSNNSLEKLV